MTQSADLNRADSNSEPLAPGRALRLQAYGGPESLTVDSVSAPEPGPGEVLVSVKAAAVNGIDWKIREGYLRERFKLATMLSSIGHEDEMRLSCQCTVHGDCTIETRPAFNWSGDNFWQKPYPNK